MNEATFTANRLEDALALVKRALGADALILSSRRLDCEGEPRFEVRAMADGPRETEPPRPADTRSVVERVLARNELAPAIARGLMKRIPGTPRSLREAEQALERAISDVLGFVGSARSSRVIALVGPTGVGKTTTIAKLAARDALIERLGVVLVSADDYRVGGVEQLETYAQLIGVPFEVASGPGALARAIARHPRADRVYVDTSGRAPRDRGALVELAQTLSAAGATIDVHLCIAAATRGGELEAVLDHHAPLAPRALTITKLDEAYALGALVTAPVRAGLPLAWLTTGQRVPEDIELASAARMAAALCGEEIGA